MAKELNLIILQEGIQGYSIDDIKAYLSHSEWLRFSEWIGGQTGAVTKEGKFLVYKWDWDRYCKGLPVID